MEAKEQRERQHEQILRLKENNIQLTTEVFESTDQINIS